jgi:hypothetical protein
MDNFLLVGTSMSSLEGINLGLILNELQKEPVYKNFKDKVDKFIKDIPDNISSIDEIKKKKIKLDIADILTAFARDLTEVAMENKKLSKKNLILELENKIKECSHNQHELARDLVELTFQKELENIKRNTQNICSELVIDLISSYRFIFPDQIASKDKNINLHKVRLFYDVLISWTHNQYLKGFNCNFFRMLEARYWLNIKMNKPKSKEEEINYKYWLENYKITKRKSDLCDVQLINYALLGCQGKASRCFTTDETEKIESRSSIMVSSLKELNRQVEGWKILPCLGTVYCLSRKKFPYIKNNIPLGKIFS